MNKIICVFVMLAPSFATGQIFPKFDAPAEENGIFTMMAEPNPFQEIEPAEVSETVPSPQDCPGGVCPPPFEFSDANGQAAPQAATPSPVVSWSDTVTQSNVSTGVKTYGASTGVRYVQSYGSTGARANYVTRSVTRQRVRYIPSSVRSFPGIRTWRPFQRLRQRRQSGVMMRSSSYVYPPFGQSIGWHLRRDHGINTAGMSYQQMMQLHTQLH